MLNVKTSGLIYKFQENGLFSESCTPDNLCPYMRRFIRLVIGTFIAYMVIMVAAAGVVAAPLYLWLGGAYENLGWYFNMYTTLGWGVWIFTIGGSIVWGFNRLFSKEYASRRAMNRAASKYIAEPVKRVYKRNIFVQWYKAVHDKICPQLNFVKKETS